MPAYQDRRRARIRHHMLLSMLCRTVEAMGGTLLLIAKSPDRHGVELSGIFGHETGDRPDPMSATWTLASINHAHGYACFGDELAPIWYLAVEHFCIRIRSLR